MTSKLQLKIYLKKKKN